VFEEDLSQRYLEGECHVMAVALQRMFGGRFVLFCEDTGDYWDPETGDPVPAVHHVCIEFADGRVVDVSGVRDGGNVLGQWEALNDEGGDAGFSILRLDDEDELMEFVDEGEYLPLASFCEQDVEEAERCFLDRHPGIGLGYDSMAVH
jgi:hypothetical protein